MTYSMSRDNMLPLSHIWRHVSPTRRTPAYAVMGLGVLSTALLLSALVNLQAFNYILGIGSLAFFVVYILQTVGLIIGVRRGTIPAGEPGLFDLGRYRMPLYLVAVVCRGRAVSGRLNVTTPTDSRQMRAARGMPRPTPTTPRHFRRAL